MVIVTVGYSWFVYWLGHSAYNGENRVRFPTNYHLPAGLVELAYTVDLKSAAIGHKGSNPLSGTNRKQEAKLEWRVKGFRTMDFSIRTKDAGSFQTVKFEMILLPHTHCRGGVANRAV